MAMPKIKLSANMLKIIGAFSMLLDHVGVIFFPRVYLLRIIGRLSYPIFAFMIAEGCYYTKNKMRYFASVFILGAICQSVYVIYDGTWYLNILITFSLSILLVYLFEYVKGVLIKGSRKRDLALAVLAFAAALALVYVLNTVLRFDYGFWGCLTPLFASVFKIPRGIDTPHPIFKKRYLDVLGLGLGLVLMAVSLGWYQPYALLALPLLLLYSGERGKLKMKYFFYVFYPLHLLLLEAINLVLR